MDRKLISTANEIPGYTISENLGIVRGIMVRSRSLVSNIGAGIQSLFGGKIDAYVEMCEQTRQEAFDLMISHAEKMGADAIVGMRFDANDVMDGITEVLCYGTAVKVSSRQ